MFLLSFLSFNFSIDFFLSNFLLFSLFLLLPFLSFIFSIAVFFLSFFLLFSWLCFFVSFVLFLLSIEGFVLGIECSGFVYRFSFASEVLVSTIYIITFLFRPKLLRLYCLYSPFKFDEVLNSVSHYKA